MNILGTVIFGQYRVTYVQEVINGEIVVHSYAEVFVPESWARGVKGWRRAHWRICTGKKRDRVIAAARHPELRASLQPTNQKVDQT